jgi:hypothetical protein
MTTFGPKFRWFALSILMLAPAGCGSSDDDAAADAAASADAAPTVDAAPGSDAAAPGSDAAAPGPDAAAPDAAVADAGGGGGGGGPCATTPHFSRVMSDVVMIRCGGPINCHRGGHILGGGLDLNDENAWASLVNVPAVANPAKVRVVPGDVEGSFLWQKLNDTQTEDEGAPMPNGDGIRWQQLPPAQLELVRCWIAGGAQND